MPAAYRDELKGACITTKSADSAAISGYSNKAFRKEASKIQKDIDNGKKSEDDMRAFTGIAEPLNVDAQGRITLSAELREKARLGREVLVVGVMHRFEIWAPEVFDQRVDQFSAAAEGRS